MVVFCCKIRSAIWGYPGFRATTERHPMGISGIRSKQLRAPSNVSRAWWVKTEFMMLGTHQRLHQLDYDPETTPFKLVVNDFEIRRVRKAKYLGLLMKILHGKST